MNAITKAIIPVAGWGTRRLPITKAIEKCMLPIGNRPLVDYIVRDCIQAGIMDIYFVVGKGSTQLQTYFSENEQLNQFLQYNGNEAMLQLAHPPAGVNFHYIEQDINKKYGTAVPVAMAVPSIPKGESVVVMMGDDFIYNQDGSSELMRQKAFTADGGNSMLAVQVPREDVSRYGVIQFNPETNAFEQIVEKPQPDQAPSNYINVSKYIMNYDLLTRVYNYCNLDLSGEYQLTDPINQYVLDGGIVNVVPAQGQYLDGGNVHGWFHANEVVLRGGSTTPRQ